VISALLTAAGYEVRGNRFNCRCEGGARLTGSLSEEKDVAYCHRCHARFTARSLASGQGVTLPPARIKRTRIVRRQFSEWLKAKRAELCDRERRLARRAEWAKVALESFPDMECAWGVLAEWYHARQAIETFWESIQGRVGLYWLYRAWRRFA
jgi:hypothetical protein